MVSENILVRSHKSFRNKEERQSYMVSVVREILGNLQKCMKSKKINETDKRHCMLHLHIHATLYSMCRLVVPFLEMITSWDPI